MAARGGLKIQKEWGIVPRVTHGAQMLTVNEAERGVARKEEQNSAKNKGGQGGIAKDKGLRKGPTKSTRKVSPEEEVGNHEGKTKKLAKRALPRGNGVAKTCRSELRVVVGRGCRGFGVTVNGGQDKKMRKTEL